MDIYLLISYETRPTPTHHLTWISTRILDPNRDTQHKIISFPQLQEAENLRKMVVRILQQLHEFAIKFLNCVVVADSQDFFQLLAEQLQSQNLRFPFAFQNSLGLKETFLEAYSKEPCQFGTLLDIARFYSEFHTVDTFNLMQKIIFRMKMEGKLRKRRSFILEDYPCQESLFKIVGLPYSINKRQLIDSLLSPKHPRDVYQIVFLQQHKQFTGNVLVKVCSEMRDQMLRKHGTYLGKRYIQIFQLKPDEYINVKNRFSFTYQRANYHKIQAIYDQFTTSQKSRRRSRSRHSLSPTDGMQPQKTAIRIRGLPFEFSVIDVEKLFLKYKPIRGYTKLGHRKGRKSGEAMVLLPSYENAVQSMSMDGQTVSKRYIELKIATCDQYNRFS